MPERIEKYAGREMIVATEDELLEFCNSVREAGGADPIGALFPSDPDEPESCLIARALNFSCAVNGPYDTQAWLDKLDQIDEIERPFSWPNLFYKGSQDNIWVMLVQQGNAEQSNKKAEEVAKKLGLHHVNDEILLPQHIGNAAAAFDVELAFTEYNTRVILRNEENNDEENELDD
jgi:hypothetical protein